jgi:hypothetical protein
MKEKSIVITSAAGLLLGCISGMAGSIVPSDTFRNLAWAMGSTGIILAGALLTMYYFRKGNDIMAAGFLILSIAESTVFSSCATSLNDNISSFGAGVILWALSISVISLQKIFPLFVRCTGAIAAILFTILSVRIFTGHSLNALAKPLPYYAYPFYAATLFGWTWTLLRKNSLLSTQQKRNAERSTIALVK